VKRILSTAACLAALGCGQAPSIAPPAKAPAMTREAFTSAVVGKASDAVLKLLGRPHATYKYDNGTSAWVYRDLAYDPIAAKLVPMQWVEFSKAGVCTGVRF
jgi:hypothetical protein